jgi:hypothetical protein
MVHTCKAALILEEVAETGYGRKHGHGTAKPLAAVSTDRKRAGLPGVLPVET